MRILFVAMADSIHTARWLNQLAAESWEIHLFPVVQPEVIPPHPQLTDKVLVYSSVLFRRDPAKINLGFREAGLNWPFPFRFGAGRVQRFLEAWQPALKSQAGRLAAAIRWFKPDIVHSMEMQHAAYLTLEARNLGTGNAFPAWIYSSWGSDIFFFGRQPEHKERIQEVMAACDYYIADCQRDIQLAREFGFCGETLGVLPVVGGYDIQLMQQLRQPGPSSARKVIVLKGYHDDNWAGRALVALQALYMLADCLAGYEIVIYFATLNVRYAAEYMARITGLNITVLPQSPHDEIVKLMGRARLAISVNVTDGTPNSMLEAMVMGAFPIQSDTISTAEWITQGANGLLVPPEDPVAIAAAIRRALTDDNLVDRAAEMNTRLTAERIDRTIIQPQVIKMYQKVAAQGPFKRE